MTLEPRLQALLDRARAAPHPYARAIASDADGTLWAGDVGDELFCRVAARDAFRGAGLAKLRAHGERLLGPEARSETSQRIATTLFERYAAGVIDVRTMCDLEAETVADRAEHELAALVDEVAREAAARARPEVRGLLEAASAEGFAVHVVSGSLGWVVERALEIAKLPHTSVTGAVLVRAQGVVHAEIERTSPLFEGKVDALRATGAWPAAMGLGDGGWDHTFLRQTFLPVLVHPKPALVEAMKGVAYERVG